MADRRYGAIARRLNAPPRRAAKQIEPGSVDVLALDVSASDTDMEDVLDRWLSRVSERGIVLMPGINRRESGCVAHEHFAALQSTYRSLTFHHGDGLGILVVGERPADLIETLLSRWNAPTAARTVREVFARLGRGCADQALAEAQTARLRDSSNRLDQVSKEREAKEAEVSELQARLREREAYLDELESDKLHLAEEVSDAHNQVQSLQVELRQANTQVATLESLYQEAENQRKRLDDVVSEKEASIQTRFEELAILTQIAEEREKTVQQLQQANSELQARVDELSSALEASQAQSDERQGWNSELQARVDELSSALEARQAQSDERQQWESERSALMSELAELRQLPPNVEPSQTESRCRELEAALKERDENIATRFKELAILTRMLEEKDVEIAALKCETAEIESIDNGTSSTASSASSVSEEVVSPQSGARAATAASRWALGRFSFGAERDKRKERRRLRRKRMEALAELEASKWFDAQWYLKQYPDIAGDERYSTTPALHYLKFGGFEGRDPSPYFDSAGYLEAYPDVALTEINPLLHFIRDGINEGRSPRP